MQRPETILRLKHKYAPAGKGHPPVDAGALLAEQSLGKAALGALLACIVLNVIWVYAGLLFDRFFPWFSVVQGFFIGRAVRHFGRGVDWRFPVLAAAAALLAAFSGSFLSALYLTGREFDTPALSLIAEISWHTLDTFVSREFGVVGTIYAGTAAVIAAYFANRRLDRYQAVALRKHGDGERR